MASDRFNWDDQKRALNLTKHGVDFLEVEHFNFDTALIVIDDRRDYGETRYLAFGEIDDRLHALVFAARGEKVRVISLRRANDRERRNYAKSKKEDEAEG